MEGVWHQVLGNYDPREEGWCEASVPSPTGRIYTTQRLCDQQLAEYTEVELRYVYDCAECRRVQGLMDEYATTYPSEEMNGAADAVGDERVVGLDGE